MWNEIFEYIGQISGDIFPHIDYGNSSKQGNPLVYENEKQINIVRMLEIWLLASNFGVKVSEILKGKGVRSVVIYGLSCLGMCLWNELRLTDINVCYGYDKNTLVEIPELEVKHEIGIPTGDEDAVIVTALTTYDSIKKELLKIGYDHVLALDEILYEMIPEDTLVSGS